MSYEYMSGMGSAPILGTEVQKLAPRVTKDACGQVANGHLEWIKSTATKGDQAYMERAAEMNARKCARTGLTRTVDWMGLPVTATTGGVVTREEGWCCPPPEQASVTLVTSLVPPKPVAQQPCGQVSGGTTVLQSTGGTWWTAPADVQNAAREADAARTAQLVGRGCVKTGRMEITGSRSNPAQEVEWCCPAVLSTPPAPPPTATTSPPTQVPVAVCNRFLASVPRSQVQSIAGRWRRYQEQLEAWRAPLPASEMRMVGARGPVPTFLGTAQERACGPHAEAWLAANPEKPWYKHPAVLVGGGVAAALVAMKLMGSRTAGPVRNPQVRLSYEPMPTGGPAITEKYKVTTDKGTLLGTVFHSVYQGWVAQPKGGFEPTVRSCR